MIGIPDGAMYRNVYRSMKVTFRRFKTQLSRLQKLQEEDSSAQAWDMENMESQNTLDGNKNKKV